MLQLWNCGNNVNGSIIKHKSSFSANKSKCQNCQTTGHFTKCCKNNDIKMIERANEIQMKYATLAFYNCHMKYNKSKQF